MYGFVCCCSSSTQRGSQGLAATLAAMLITGGIVGLAKLGIRVQLSRISRRAKGKASKIDKTKPDFLTFYQAWDRGATEAELKAILVSSNSIAVGTVGVATVSALSDFEKDRKDKQIRNAVDNELRRRGID